MSFKFTNEPESASGDSAVPTNMFDMTDGTLQN